MPAYARLDEIPEQYWGNLILYRLALELGYVAEEVDGEFTIECEPDIVLEEALEAVAQFVRED